MQRNPQHLRGDGTRNSDIRSVFVTLHGPEMRVLKRALKRVLKKRVLKCHRMRINKFVLINVQCMSTSHESMLNTLYERI